MNQEGADVLVLSMLDEIAWLTNLRGSDVAHNPVFESYAVILQERALCFCHHPDSGIAEQRPEWEFELYENYLSFIQDLASNSTLKIWLDPDATTMGTKTVFDTSQVLESQNSLQGMHGIPPQKKLKKNMYNSLKNISLLAYLP